MYFVTFLWLLCTESVVYNLIQVFDLEPDLIMICNLKSGSVAMNNNWLLNKPLY